MTNINLILYSSGTFCILSEDKLKNLLEISEVIMLIWVTIN